MTWGEYSADQFESAIADALHDKDLQAAVSLLRRMAVVHPTRCGILLNGISGILDELAEARG